LCIITYKTIKKVTFVNFLYKLLAYLFGWGDWFFILLLLFIGYNLLQKKEYELKISNYLGLLLLIIGYSGIFNFFVLEFKYNEIISLGSGGGALGYLLGYLLDYRSRMEALFNSLKAAMEHLKAEGKDGTINIMVFGDFGRNVNLNSSYGWDHGNLQNFYLFGGKNYFNHLGVVGETQLEQTGEFDRLYLKPATDSYWFEPYSIAATLYSIYGITNPEYLTDGFGPIEEDLLSINIS